jgi:ABC-2 type transport system ATP-binding protein
VDSTRFAVFAEGLEKRYGKVKALDGLDLQIPEGKACGLLGPNGAGKTTAVRILSTLLRPDGGLRWRVSMWCARPGRSDAV